MEMSMSEPSRADAGQSSVDEKAKESALEPGTVLVDMINKKAMGFLSFIDQTNPHHPTSLSPLNSLPLATYSVYCPFSTLSSSLPLASHTLSASSVGSISRGRPLESKDAVPVPLSLLDGGAEDVHLSVSPPSVPIQGIDLESLRSPSPPLSPPDSPLLSPMDSLSGVIWMEGFLSIFRFAS